MHGSLKRGGGLASPEEVCAIAARLAASAYGIGLEQILSDARTRAVSTARQIGMYLAHTVSGLPLGVVAAFFGRDRTTVAHACALIEDRRDDAAFEARLTVLEDLLRAVSGMAR